MGSRSYVVPKLLLERIMIASQFTP